MSQTKELEKRKGRKKERNGIQSELYQTRLLLRDRTMNSTFKFFTSLLLVFCQSPASGFFVLFPLVWQTKTAIVALDTNSKIPSSAGEESRVEILC